jgi:glycosyltransferase involved in cell wall biosynthesis
MRIALLSWESLHSVYVGGIANHVSELAAALARSGHDVHLFTRLGQAQQRRYERIDAVHYHRCGFMPRANFVENIKAMCQAFGEAVLQTEDFGGAFDVIHAHDWLTVPAMEWLNEARGSRSVLTMHSTEYGRCGNQLHEGDSARIRAIEATGIAKADRVVTVSKALGDEIQRLYGVPDDKIEVVYNGVRCHQFDGGSDPAEVRARHEIAAADPLILFAGRMVYQKGPDLLLEALPRLLEQHASAKIVFAGEGDMRRGLQEKADAMGLRGATRFTGHLNGAALTDLFKAADAVCVPSRNEPFGIIVLEAWSAGKPVVACNRGGPAEIIWPGVNGYTVDTDPHGLAWGLSSILADVDNARRMGRNGRITVESAFSWDAVAAEVLAIYEVA